MQYLQDKQYYVDMYDLFTVKRCIKWYWDIKKGMEVHRKDFKPEGVHTDFDEEVHKCVSYLINGIKGERYRHRAETIQEWMDKDKRTQDRFDNTLPPIGVSCKYCGGETRLEYKDLRRISDPDEHVLFMFECFKCGKRASYYGDGRQLVPEPEKCPECAEELITKSRKGKDRVITLCKCQSCGYCRSDILELKRDNTEWERKQEENHKLLEEYRKEFCLDDSNGPEYLRDMDGMINLVKEWKAREKKEADPDFQKANKLKKLTVHELQKLLTPVLEAENYVNFALGVPDMGRFVAIGFTATDSKEGRVEYDSRQKLKKLIEKTLTDTNWRLMSEGISYRIGIVSGRLRAYEGKDQLISLISKGRHESKNN